VDRSGSLDPDLMAHDARVRASSGGRAAAVGGEQPLAGETQSRVPGHRLAHGLHLDVAGDATNLTRAARPADTRRRTTRRGGDTTPASAHGRHKARVRKQAAPASSSPPSAAPGRLLVGRRWRRRRTVAVTRARVPAAARVYEVARVWVTRSLGWRRQP
jgi:hypothetical protein